MTTDSPLANATGTFHGVPHSSVELVTPELAEKYLALNITHNRNINIRRVLEYSRQMQTGQWQLAAAISFNNQGRLIDGQHRLSAVVHSGVSCYFVVVRGYPEDSVSCFDLGARRNAANIASIKGIKANHNTLAIAKAMLIPRHGIHYARVASPHEVIAIFKKYEESISLSFVGAAGNGGIVRSAPVRAAIARAHAWGENHERLSELLSVLNTGYPVSSDAAHDSAAIALRNFYIKSRSEDAIKDHSEHARISLFYRSQSAIVNFLGRKDIRLCRENRQKMWTLPDIDERPLHELLLKD